MGTLELFLFFVCLQERDTGSRPRPSCVSAPLSVDLEREGVIPGRTMVTSTLETISSEEKDAIKKELAEVRI